MHLINYLNVVLIIGATFLLFVKSPKSKFDYYLASLLILLLATSVVNAFFIEELLGYLIFYFLQLTLAPLLYFYIRQLKSKKQSNKWVHYIAPVFHFLLIGFVIVEKWDADTYFESPVFYLQLFFNLIVLILYGIIFLLDFQKERWNIKKGGALFLSWYKTWLIVFCGFLIINFCYAFLYNVSDDQSWISLLEAVVLFGLILYLVWTSYRLGIIYPKNKQAILDKHKQENVQWLQLYNRLDKLVKTEELFLNPALKIEDLSRKLNTNSRYISKAVNTSYGDSVTNYLNDLRLDTFKKFLNEKKSQHLSIDALALDCGFNSKSSFYRFFKLRERMTPLDFQYKIEKGI